MPIISEIDKRALRGAPRRSSDRKHARHADRRRRLFLLLFTLLLILIGIVFSVIVLLPVLREPAELAEDTALSIEAGKRGSIALVWDAARHTSGYRLEIFDPEDDTNKLLYERFCRKANCTLRPAELSLFPDDRPVEIRITARNTLFFMDKEEDGEESAEVVFNCCMTEPEIADLREAVNVEEQNISLQWSGWGGDSYTLFLNHEDGYREMLREIQMGEGDPAQMERRQYEVTVPYGPRGDFRIPRDDGTYAIEMEVERRRDRVVFQGKTAEVLSLTKADLMSQKIELFCDKLLDNLYRISWNDTGSFAYRVELLRPGADTYELLGYVNGGGDLSYETKEHLRPGKEYSFRVSAVNADELFELPADAPVEEVISGRFDEAEDGALRADEGESDGNAGVLSVFTDESALYANIWPTKNLDVFAAADREEKVGVAAAGKCLCVLAEDRDSEMFRVRVGDAEGYIDSNYCMINLPDYVGDLCQYDIPNSYASIYMVNDYYIPNVTAQVTPGYEDILLDDNTFLVPLLYPVALKLADAAEATMADGYRIEINDSFRPHCATRYIYDETNKVLYWRLPDIKFWGYRTPFDKYVENGRRVEEPPLSATPAGYTERMLSEQVTDSAEDGAQQMGEDAGMQMIAAAEQPTATENARNTYYWEMTNGSYRLGSFLAAVASRHNLGVAMDMTLVNVENGYRHMDMQTQMHNLSWYSAMSRNNQNADILKGYLTAAGFGTISSEWWHFQDNDVTASLNPPIVENGVNVEGWKKDDFGWRYRDKKGNYLTDQTKEIEGVVYTFDQSGYTAY